MVMPIYIHFNTYQNKLMMLDSRNISLEKLRLLLMGYAILCYSIQKAR